MRRQPGFTALIAVTLALGVGANAAMVGLVDVLMFRTPAYVQQPDRLVSIDRAGNYVRYQALREHLGSIELAAYVRQPLSFGAGADAISIRAECVTPGYFPLLGMAPPVGRGFVEVDDAMGAPRTIVLSHDFWTSRFGRDPRVLGTSLTLAGRPHEVIGVASRGFTGVELGAIDAWILLAASPEACSFTGTNLLRSAGGSWLSTIGRLREGVTLPQAAAEIAAAQVHVADRPGRVVDGRVAEGSFELRPLYASRRLSLSHDSRLALWLAGGAAVLLLLACANVAGLLWTHTLDRGREIAVRLQLGASRRRVFGQLMIEHMLIAAIGGAAAVVVGMWISDGIRTYFPFAVDAGLMSGRTLVVVAVLAFASGVLSGAVPGIQASKAGTERFLRTGAALMGSRSRFRTALLSVQVGLALVLVTAAGLFTGSVDNFRRDFAYDLDRVVVASIDFRKSSTRTPQEIHGTFEMLMDRVRQLPEVEMAALSSAPVLSAAGFTSVFPVSRSENDPGAEFHALAEVTPEYFATLGLRMAAGRAFTDADSRAAVPSMVVNESLARTLFPGEDPIGKHVFVGRQRRDIIGVSQPFRSTIRPGSQADSQIFAPLVAGERSGHPPQVLLIRTSRRAHAEVATIAGALQGAAPDLPHVDVRTLESLADAEARSWLLGATVFGLFGTLAVILAGIGIYGALAFSIRQRTVEIGVRMALGAMRRDIARLVLQHGAVVVALGLVLGLAGAFAASRFIESLLFNVAAADPTTFAIASAVVVVCALLGCIVPAIRAARVDPAVALRYD
jgi:putative ABC transport system permease protein